MTKPVTGQTTFGANTTGTTTQLDNNFLLAYNALNDLNTYPNYLSDTGSANAVVVTLAANLTGALTDGLVIQVKIAATNTGATNLNYNAGGNKGVTTLNGDALIGGELIANSIQQFVYSSGATKWILMTPSVLFGTTASTFTFDGSGGTTGSLTMTWTKFPKFVELNIPVCQATAGTGSTMLASNTALPTSVRPAASQTSPIIPIVNNASQASAPGMVLVTSGGIVQIYRDGAATAYTNSQTAGTAFSADIRYFVG